MYSCVYIYSRDLQAWWVILESVYMYLCMLVCIFLCVSVSVYINVDNCMSEYASSSG